MTNRKHSASALAHMNAALSMIGRARKLTPELMEEVSGQIRSATEMLLKPDPMTDRANFVLLAFRNSTRYTSKVIRGKLIERVEVHDLGLYNWAMSQVHTYLIFQDNAA